jgi:hypothetical protein
MTIYLMFKTQFNMSNKLNDQEMNRGTIILRCDPLGPKLFSNEIKPLNLIDCERHPAICIATPK